jgi:hypothetical protein
VLQDLILDDLRLTPLTRFGLSAEDGTAARIGLGLLETAVARAIESADDDLDDEDLDENGLNDDDLADMT